MLRINNRGFKRSYVYGGTGIFDSIAKAAVSLLPVVQKGALQVGKKLGEKGVQKVSSLVSKSPSKSVDMLKINESLATDESIEEYEYHEYEPITGANLNNPGEIRITVQTQDIFYHPSESYNI